MKLIHFVLASLFLTVFFTTAAHLNNMRTMALLSESTNISMSEKYAELHSSAAQKFKHEGGNGSFSAAVFDDDSVETSASWIKVEGWNGYSVNYSVQPNDGLARKATIKVIKRSGFVEKVIFVEEDGK